ncbi:MAG: hypothetical protein JO316_13065 [Abitibacteriaceae bacterium]|nr:hypothetical protein [Abditibacteriaceae bacterium]
MKKYWRVAVLGWQDSLVYRFNAVVWVWYAVLPSITLMLVWLAAYQSKGRSTIGNFDLPGMMTYYLCVTVLSIIITPHPEWDIAQQVRDGKITQFIVRPIGYFGYRFAQETSYQIVKSFMMLPALGVMVWLFHAYLRLPVLDGLRWAEFFLSALLAYMLLSQFKFLLGISAFWLAEPGGFLEIWNVLVGVMAGRLLPVSLLPGWLQRVSTDLPFSSFYAFPMRILLSPITAEEIRLGLTRQCLWLLALAFLVRWTWNRGLLAYEAYGG